jgi:hypothetical protein
MQRSSLCHALPHRGRLDEIHEWSKQHIIRTGSIQFYHHLADIFSGKETDESAHRLVNSIHHGFLVVGF